ncbi:hypothetical protein B0O99DRAFT_686429 [Bisporella sp. PMI_857]|nr:hypothetical protein B0O99DRAFT_686429 [Bisporella sp. PMI_857]
MAMASVNQKSKTVPRFKFFSRLPPELQLKVWAEAANNEDPRLIEIKFDVSTYLYYHETAVPPLLHTCGAARAEALKHYDVLEISCNIGADVRRSMQKAGWNQGFFQSDPYSLRVYFNYARDIIMPSPHSIFRNLALYGPLRYGSSPSMSMLHDFVSRLPVNKIQYFALPNSNSRPRPDAIADALHRSKSLGSLKMLVFAYTDPRNSKYVCAKANLNIIVAEHNVAAMFNDEFGRRFAVHSRELPAQVGQGSLGIGPLPGDNSRSLHNVKAGCWQTIGRGWK